MVFVESPAFSRFIDAHDLHAALVVLQTQLVRDPLAGNVIPGGRGLRKLRWALPGRGKRGGARAIYYVWIDEDRIYLLYAYAKIEQTDLTPQQLRVLADTMKAEQEHGKKSIR